MPAKKEPDGLPCFLRDGQQLFAPTKNRTESSTTSAHAQRIIDPNDPLHDLIENLTVGMTPEERAEYLINLVKSIDQLRKDQV